MRRLLTLTLLCAFSTTAFASSKWDVSGDWQTPTDTIIRVAPCGAYVCLTVVRPSPQAPETTDEQNPDPDLRNRPLCGLTVGTGFAQPDPDHLTNGRLYDPITGHTYHGTITAQGNTLSLRGYLGIPLFGRTETWHRVPPITACR
jgi:uncharacterized protein (DUF2147 family)